jgi:heme O synthase-like polyprenyltransferase
MASQALALVRNRKSDKIMKLKQTRLTVQEELRKRDDELLISKICLANP